MSIYSNLFKCCKGQNENFLTEAFCDVINNRLDNDARRNFINRIFYGKNIKGKIEFITQYRTEYDNENKKEILIPDIICINDEKDFIIEVKIDAPFTPNQSNLYRDKCGADNLYLITAYTKPPKDNKIFDDKHIIFWKDIYKELSSSSYNSFSMVSEFTEFLAENGWGICMPDAKDFKKFGEFLSDNTALRISTFLKNLRTELKYECSDKYNFINWNAHNPTNGNWGSYFLNAPSTFDYFTISHDKLHKNAIIEWGFYNPGNEKDGFCFNFDDLNMDRRFLVWLDIYCYNEDDAAAISNYFSRNNNNNSWKLSKSGPLNEYPIVFKYIDLDNFDINDIMKFIICWFKKALENFDNFLQARTINLYKA